MKSTHQKTPSSEGVKEHESVLSSALKRFTEARRRYYELIDSLDGIKNKLQSSDICEDDCVKVRNDRRPGVLSEFESEIDAFENHNDNLYYLIQELNDLI